MKNLAAMLFHPSATPEKPESARAPKQADSFARVLQASLGDSRRDSRPGSSSAPPAEILPRIDDTRAPAPETAKDGQAEDGQQIPTRRDRSKSESQVGLNATAPESVRQDRPTRAARGTATLQPGHRGYAANPSPQTTDAHPAGTSRAEAGRAQALMPSQPKPETVPAGKGPEDTVTSEQSRAASLLPKPMAKPETANRRQTDGQAPAATAPSATGTAATEPSGEREVPSTMSVLAHTLASPEVPSLRACDHLRPQPRSIAAEGRDAPAPKVRKQEVLAVPGGRPVPAHQEGPFPFPVLEGALQGQAEPPSQQASIQRNTPELPLGTRGLVAPDPASLDTALAEPEGPPIPSPRVLSDAKAPATEPRSAGEMPRKQGESGHHRHASALATPVQVSPELPGPSDEPSRSVPPSATMPTVIAASPAPLPRPTKNDDGTAKSIAHHAAFLTQAAIPAIQASSPPTTEANREPVTWSSPAGQQATRGSTNPLSSRHHHGQPGPGAIQPEREGASRELPTSRPRVAGSKPSTQAAPIANQARPDRAFPRTKSNTMVDGLDRPAMPAPRAAGVAEGQVKSGRPVAMKPIPETSSMGQPAPQPRSNAPAAQAPEQPELVAPVPLAQPSAHTIIPSAPTSSRETLRASSPSVPSVQTRSTDTPSAAPSHALPSVQTVSSDTLSAAPWDDGSAQPPTPVSTVLATEQAQGATPSSDKNQPARPAPSKLNHGEQVGPVAPQLKAESATPSASASPSDAPVDLDAARSLPVEPTSSAEATPSLPVVESPPPSVTLTAPVDGPSRPPRAEHTPVSGHPSPRSPHSDSRPAHPENAAKPVAPSLPSPAPQIESQPEPAPAKAEEEHPDAPAPAAVPLPPQVVDAPQPVLSATPQPSSPPVVLAAPPTPSKPVTRSDELAPSAAPVPPASLGPTAPSLSTTPIPSPPPQAEDARTHRRFQAARDDARFTEAATSPVPQPQPPQARPHSAPAPTSGASHETQKSSGIQSSGAPALPQTAPELPSTHAASVDLPAPVQASPSPSEPSLVAPASSTAVASPPPLETRHAHLPNQVASLAARGVDDGLNMTVMPHAAHMSIESRDGDLDLHLRVRHGSADVTVGGSMAPLFETRAPEARAALASEGLNLGRFDLGQQGGGGQQGQPAPERPERPAEPATPYRHQSNNQEPAPGDGRIHVTA